MNRQRAGLLARMPRPDDGPLAGAPLPEEALRAMIEGVFGPPPSTRA